MPPSPLRLILSLGLTQIVGYGTLYYGFAVMAPAIATDLGVPLSLVFAVFSATLLAGAFAAPATGRFIDRAGARRALMLGSGIGAVALAVLAAAPGFGGFVAGMALVEVATLLATYDAAFAAVSQALGQPHARRAITQMTLMGGFASTVFWPLTGWIMAQADWRTAALTFAALHLCVCLPLHAALPRAPLTAPPRPHAPRRPLPDHPPLPAAAHPRAMRLVGASFALAGFVFSAVTAGWVVMLAALGVGQTTALAAGALMGPAQVAVRLADMLLGGHLHPLRSTLIALGLLVAALAVLGLAGTTVAGAFVFAALFGLSQGLTSIVRGTVPLALFGPVGYATRLGQLARLRLIAAAIAPFVITAVIAQVSVWAALALAGVLAVAATLVLARLRPTG